MMGTVQNDLNLQKYQGRENQVESEDRPENGK